MASTTFCEFRTSNGLQVIVESNPSVHSVAAGFFVRTGARDETVAESGVSHFLEHMAFKGDERFSADDVNRIFDEIGANYNASTSEEQTIYYAAVLPEFLPTTMDLLSVLMQPSLRQEDFDLEKNVILEEIGMYDDMPSFMAYDRIMAAYFASHPLGQSILGTTESISALTSEQMRDYYRRRYCSGNITLVFAGRINEQGARELAEKLDSSVRTGDAERVQAAVRPDPEPKLLVRDDQIQQHIMQCAAAPDPTHPLRFAAELLAVIAGEDSGSRMYWDIVDPGYAESAELAYNDFDGAGCYMTYLCCLPNQVEANGERMQQVFDDLNANGVTPQELDQARNRVASRVVLRGERPLGRLSSLGGNWMYRREYRSIADDLATIRSITAEDIRRLLDEFPLELRSVAGVGPMDALPGSVCPRTSGAVG